MHRAARYLRPADDDLDERDLMWAASVLEPAERPLFSALADADRAHSVRVARLVEARVVGTGDEPDPWMVRAALLHDVGKAQAPLGRTGRAVATVAAWLGGGRLLRRFRDHPGTVGRVARYCGYPDLGAELLRGAGSDPRVVAWAAEHHRSESTWSVPVDDGRVLAACDDAG